MEPGAVVLAKQAFGILVVDDEKTLRYALEATKAGCFDYIGKPFELDHMKLVIKNALSQTRLSEEVTRLRAAERRRAGSTLIVGGSSKLAKVFETIRKV